MQILIDNLDGKGDIDYTSNIELDGKTLLVRRLNKPASLNFRCVLDEEIIEPSSNARVTLKCETGKLLFIGYIYGQHSFNFLGYKAGEMKCSIAVTAFSGEMLFDNNPFQTATSLLDMPAQQAWKTLSVQSSDMELQPVISGQVPNCARFTIQVGTKWSEAASALASSTRSAYHFMDQQLEVVPVAQNTHLISLDDPGLKLHHTDEADLRWLASEVILTGKTEPQAYVSEVFEGDGSTSEFQLSRPAFRLGSNDKEEIRDAFQGKVLNPRIWSVKDPGSYISLAAGGLTCTGGPGRSGESIVASGVQVELGGTVLLEARAVCVKSGSSGQMLGLYVSSVESENCFAAFNISSSDTSIIVQPIINGLISGSSINISDGHVYTLRIRLNLPNVERIQQRYVYKSDPEYGMYGGNCITSAGTLIFDVQDTTSGASSSVVNLFSGYLESIPPSCILGLINNVNLTCNFETVQYSRTSPLYVSIAEGGSTSEQQAGNALDGAKCRLTTANQIAFNADSIPALGALVCVSYRTAGRSVARRQLVSTEALNGRTSLWMGSIMQPSARNSIDCGNAALAMLQISSNKWSVTKGTYASSLLSSSMDIWPGDAVQIGPMPDGSYASSIIREVRFNLASSIPDHTECIISFANDWAEDLSLTVLQSIPDDVILPSSANCSVSPMSSLSELKITSVNSSTVEISTGIAAPVNGGFEVRRRDYTFGLGINPDLVLRTNTSNFAIARVAAIEEYFIRMYDENTPPNYSLFSAAVFVNVPR